MKGRTVFATAYADREMALRMEQVARAIILTKPYDEQMLQRALREALGGMRRRRPLE